MLTKLIEGIIQAESALPDVILLDLVMPNIDGLTVYEVLKDNLFTCNIPIVFVTAMVNTKTLSKLEATNAVGIITKPINAIALANDISKMCNWHLFPERKQTVLVHSCDI